ncbi:hypothetical protein [Pelagihabitans pacificus]|uniref:hypothetical protein n=1 Tax=Pelagihabitans pacificus TaxID=2696054 RepID=UPI001EE94C8F|nr:hypothetical protein [Pelagihabitans pacificus]
MKHYHFERVANSKRQLEGIDLIFKSKNSGKTFFLDEKAQLDYLNEDLPTFAFELRYEKAGVPKKGWLFDTGKQTDFYSLITGIYSDEPGKFTAAKITFVNRKKLLRFLSARNLTEKRLGGYAKQEVRYHGKVKLQELHEDREGYLFFSSQNKAEKPTNLILKLDFLVAQRIAKRFA